MNYLH